MPDNSTPPPGTKAFEINFAEPWKKENEDPPFLINRRYVSEETLAQHGREDMQDSEESEEGRELQEHWKENEGKHEQPSKATRYQNVAAEPKKGKGKKPASQDAPTGKATTKKKGSEKKKEKEDEEMADAAENAEEEQEGGEAKEQPTETATLPSSGPLAQYFFVPRETVEQEMSWYKEPLQEDVLNMVKDKGSDTMAECLAKGFLQVIYEACYPTGVHKHQIRKLRDSGAGNAQLDPKAFVQTHLPKVKEMITKQSLGQFLTRKRRFHSVGRYITEELLRDAADWEWVHWDNTNHKTVEHSIGLRNPDGTNFRTTIMSRVWSNTADAWHYALGHLGYEIKPEDAPQQEAKATRPYKKARKDEGHQDTWKSSGSEWHNKDGQSHSSSHWEASNWKESGSQKSYSWHPKEEKPQDDKHGNKYESGWKSQDKWQSSGSYKSKGSGKRSNSSQGDSQNSGKKYSSGYGSSSHYSGWKKGADGKWQKN